MKSAIQLELEDNFEEMKKLITQQIFCVGDAERMLRRYYNLIRKMEQLEKSRDMWKRRYLRLKDGK